MRGVCLGFGRNPPESYDSGGFLCGAKKWQRRFFDSLPLCEEEKKTGIPCSRAGADVRLAMAFDNPALAVRLRCRRLPGELPAGERLLRCSEQPAVFRQHTDFSTNISRKHLHKISRAGIKLAENFVQM